LLDLAVAGYGIVRLGDFLGEEALATGALVRLLDDCHEPDAQPINALILPGRQALPRVRAFIDCLAEAMAKRRI
jgi:DNA-binding transcriptional LysR family regulator